MSNYETNRRKFMKNIGLVTGGTLLGGSAVANSLHPDEIKKLNPEQQAFMENYGKWMDDFTEVIRLQKKDPYNEEYKKRMEIITQQGGEFKPELAKHMKDKTFSIIYLESIKRVKNEI
jgi:hypothetical protein